MSDTVEAVQSGPVLRSVVLLEKAPTGIGEVLELLQPGVGAKLEGFPGNALTIAINGAEVTFEIVLEHLSAREFEYAVSQSPLRSRLEAAAGLHQGYLIISADGGGDVLATSELIANVTAMYADDPNGLAVWLPDADMATTDVMYTGDVSLRSAQTWFHTVAARLDENTAIAHTVGVRHLGGGDVQLRTTEDAAYAHRELRGAVATLLEQGVLPRPGVTAHVGGVPHVLTQAASVLGMGEVLELAPIA